MPLLHIGPYGLGGDRDVGEREAEQAALPGAYIRVTGLRGIGEGLGLRLYQWSGTFEGFAVGFVAVGVLVENAVAAADSGFAVAEYIESETDARRRIKQVSGHAARRRTAHATLHQAVESISAARDQRTSHWIDRGG